MGSCFSKNSSITSKFLFLLSNSLYLVLKTVSDNKIKVHNSYISLSSIKNETKIVIIFFFQLISFKQVLQKPAPAQFFKQSTNLTQVFDVNYKNIPNKIHQNNGNSPENMKIKGLVGLSNLGNTCFINSG